MQLLNSLRNENTLLGFILWAIIMAFVGIVLALLSLGPVWMLIVVTILSIPYIFGACKE